MDSVKYNKGPLIQMSYVLRVDDSYFITKDPVSEEGQWEWRQWDARGVFMEGMRRLYREGVHVYPFVLPDNREIVLARFMVSYTTDEECDKINNLFVLSGLDTISTLQRVEIENDVKMLMFYLLP